jgi:4-alpha-glucanotransferase
VKLPRTEPFELRELAQLCGIQTFYLASDETMSEAEPEVLMALMRALGVPVERTKDVGSAIRERRSLAARRMMEPVLVVRSERRVRFKVTLPDHFEARDAWFTMQFEDGSSRRAQLLSDLTPVENLELDGQRFDRYLVDYSAHAAHVPAGYHALMLEVTDARHMTSTATSLVISAPPCPEPARGWGIFMPLHALRTEDDWGVGSYRDLARLGEWASDKGAAMVGGLPLYPTYLDPPIDPSPYRPVSRLAYNELYIDPTSLPELAASGAALQLMNSMSFLTRIENARASRLVDYEEVARLHRHMLEPMADAFFAGSSPRRGSFETFLSAHPELVAYAQFRAAVDLLGRRSVLALEDVAEIPGERAPALNYHLYCQFVAYEQLREASDANSLYADLPVGVHPDGFDPYWSPASFVSGAQGGAPPDFFFGEGQDWGFPPLHPEAIRDDGYHYLRAVLERALRHASYLRIDHVMGLQRLYVIPDGFDALHGAYVSYHADEMHAVVSLEAHRAGSVIVGEDLGTVPDEVRERMAEDRMLRSWVFQFQSTLEDPLPEVPSEVLATLNTHDTPRFSSFLWGVDIDDGQKLGHYSAEEADTRRAERALYREALFRALEIPVLATAALTNAARLGCENHLATSEARLVVIDLEELFGESEPQNRPGTEHGNWRQRGALTLEAAQLDAELNASLERFNDLRTSSTS